MNFSLINESDDSSIIKVIGVGGGGSNAVHHMFNQGIKGVDFAICNTDSQAMEDSEIPTCIQLGPTLTEGRGAGSKPNIGMPNVFKCSCNHVASGPNVLLLRTTVLCESDLV